jgi:nucleoside-diphosphate-sugar epimerase
MRIFLAGATGALGMRLLPRLVAGGHHVIATTRTPGKLEALRAAGAQPVILDALDEQAVRAAVLAARPEVVVHQMTALADMGSLRHFDREFAQTNRLRTEATAHLLAAARTAGTRRFVAQSYSGWPNARDGGRVKTEQDPLDPHPPKTMAKTMAAIRWLEAAVAGSRASAIATTTATAAVATATATADLEGIVLRYGSFYGPGTSIASDGDIVKLVRRRQMPIIGGGAGVWSFIHIDDAAEATRLAIEGQAVGIFNIVDDEPAEVSTWLPELARAVGAPPPRHLPAWLGRLVGGEAIVSVMTRVRGSANTRAKRELGWQPAYASWRDGFRHGLSKEAH